MVITSVATFVLFWSMSQKSWRSSLPGMSTDIPTIAISSLCQVSVVRGFLEGLGVVSGEIHGIIIVEPTCARSSVFGAGLLLSWQ